MQRTKVSRSEVLSRGLPSNSAQLLRDSCDSPPDISTPRLRSGLYLLRTNQDSSGDEVIYVIYWPQDATWNDDAPSAIRRNRITFMR
jgi:hypothetical protein